MLRLSCRSFGISSLIAGLLLLALGPGCSGSSGPGEDSGIITCLDDRDCPRPLTCQSGLCAQPADGGCASDLECGAGERCVLGQCVPGEEAADGGDGDDGADEGDGADQAVGPKVEVEPALVEFGNARIGESVEAALHVSSVGDAELTVFSVTLEAGTSPEFVVNPAGTLNEALPAGSQLALSVRYTPVDGSTDQGGLLIATNDPQQALVRVPLSSSYKGASEIAVVSSPAVDLELDVLDLGPVLLGGQALATVYVKNSGNGNAVLEIEDVRTEPLQSANFALAVEPAPPAWLSPYAGLCSADADCGQGGACVAVAGGPCAGGDCSCVDGAGQALDALAVTVTFTPLAAGAVEEELRIVNDETDGGGDGLEHPRVLVLRAEGLESQLAVTPNPILFENVFLGESDQLTVTVRNAGNQPLTVSAVRMLDAAGPFSVAVAGLPWALAAGAERTFTASYEPTAPGTHQDTLEIASTDPQGPALVSARGSASIRPAEVCDGADNDFDQLVDAADPDLVLTLCELQAGVCAGVRHTAAQCQAGWLACPAGLYGPDYGAEVCDGLDNDCNGTADSSDPALVLEPCEVQAGVCAGAVHQPNQCTAQGWTECEAADYLANDERYGSEICGNAVDEDCSGALDDDDDDGDGHRDATCAGGDDCDDGNPGIHPGASEVLDTWDNDCDGKVDEGLIPEGSVLVTEIMRDPDGVSDTLGEWFEVTNVAAFPINLDSWEVADTGTDAFVVDQPAGLVAQPDQSLVLCREADPAVNGGVACDYEYGQVFLLANASDEVLLGLDGLSIDGVAYDDADFPTTAGHSMSLDIAAYDGLANDLGANWCNTPALAAYELPSSDYATPGRVNPSCSGALVLSSVDPPSGIQQGGETVTLHGSGFTGASAVTLCGTGCQSFQVVADDALTCVTRAHAPADCDVRVTKGANSSTLVAGYRYTGAETDASIVWCDLQWPRATSAPVGQDTELVFGRVYKTGVTEPVGAPAGILGQLGYGPLGSDPRSSTGWRWLSAAWNPSCVGCGNNDEFMRQFNLSAAASWSYAYRFSDDGGLTFLFCDFDPGTGNGFSSADLGTLTITP
ncbi:MAG TPA: choice-of-anchor D domain-containing protein [Myxococcota bacterium]|nr:choice-of-anchor D domain-containing protein [Myxococcota bacterium]HRY94371.1 choice-of-anchor D domain-containing protein [Myxococcota bacterium]